MESYFWHRSTFVVTSLPQQTNRGEVHTLEFTRDQVATVSDLPNKCTGMITEFGEKTLMDVSRLFLASDNYFH